MNPFDTFILRLGLLVIILFLCFLAGIPALAAIFNRI
jgi:hypothetical protein